MSSENLPAEYVPVMDMVQKEESIRKGITALHKKILVSAGDEFLSWAEDKQNQFFERTIMSIAKDEKLIECFKSAEGKLSIIEAVEKAVSTGLQIGGQHAYLVPQPKKSKRKDNEWITTARFSIRDRGYYALLCGGKKPIFLDLRWGSVYEGDDCRIDKGSGTVNHVPKITDEKRKFLGCWVQSQKINRQWEVEFYPVSKINQWRDSSSSYAYATKNNKTDSPWMQWPEEMALQACIRHFCDRYENARELLASALYDDEETAREEKTTFQSIDDELSKPDDPEPELNETEEQEEKPNEKVIGEQDLF